MNAKIKIDGIKGSFTPQEARDIYNALKAIFDPEPWVAWSTTTLPNGFKIGPTINCPTVTVLDQVSEAEVEFTHN